jgi:hypothetical protein
VSSFRVWRACALILWLCLGAAAAQARMNDGSADRQQAVASSAAEPGAWIADDEPLDAVEADPSPSPDSIRRRSRHPAALSATACAGFSCVFHARAPPPR